MSSRACLLAELDGETWKTCSLCGEWLPLKFFSPHPRGTAGKQSRCRPCVYVATKERWAADPEIKARRVADVKAWQAAHPDWLDRYQRKNILSQYGLTIEKYEILLESQSGGCAICGTTEPGRKGTRYLPVDHCHVTDRVRGILCDDCNVGLARFGDDPDRLEQAAAYLRRARGGDLT